MTQAQIDQQMQSDLDDHLEQCGEWDDTTLCGVCGGDAGVCDGC